MVHIIMNIRVGESMTGGIREHTISLILVVTCVVILLKRLM